ncbi:MAG: NAD-dependent epimerase/dehydratase family protein, partial [Dehalococcoidales bacterium]|nr:NAD-dependent epimerase/dehydratase family protein [Dehalococcoidales bacterium]
LVTGGAGFIASHVVDVLIEQGHDVVVVDDLSQGDARNINPKARFYKMDIRSPSLGEVFSKERPEVVNHHAARTSVTRSLVEPSDDAEVNILGSLNLLQNCVKWRVKKIIYASSGGAIYGEPKYLPCDESHPVAPLSPYGVSKYAVELYLNSYRSNYGLDYTILRYANVYGPRQVSVGEAAVVAKFSYQMLRGLDITINGNGEQERDFVHVSDIVQANLLDMEQSGSRVYNLGSGKGVSINRLFLLLKSLTGYRHEPHYVSGPKGEIFKTYLAADRAKQELGWVAKINLKKGLEITLDFYKEAGHGA